jgi:hypothetical protein
MKKLKALDYDKPKFDSVFDVLQSWHNSLQSLKKSKAKMDFLTQGLLKILAFSFNA